MDEEYVVNGRYLAKYPDGRYSGEVGISTCVRAPNEAAAKQQAMHKAMLFHGYVDLKWLSVEAAPSATMPRTLNKQRQPSA